MADNNSFSDVDDSSSYMESDDSFIDYHRQSNNVHSCLNGCKGNGDGNGNSLDLPGPSILHISSISLQNSTDITFGNKTIYNGPVTVNQFLKDKICDPSSSTEEVVDPGFCEVKGANVEQTTKTLWCVSKWKLLATIVISSSVLLSAVIVLTLHYLSDGDDISAINIDNDHTELKMIKREKWKAKPPTKEYEDLVSPVRFVIIQHTALLSRDGEYECYTMETCMSIVFQAQSINIALDYGDIMYNFLVGGDGSAYEGRGWNVLGCHTIGYNSKSIGIGFIGDFREVAPPKQQLVAALKLIRDGVKLKQISENYTLIGANQVTQTESPGKILYQILTKLPHWSYHIDQGRRHPFEPWIAKKPNTKNWFQSRREYQCST